MSEHATDVMRTLVLNGLVDLVDNDETVLADETSVKRLAAAYEAVTTDLQREQFRTIVENMDDRTDSETETLLEITDLVIDRLAETESRATVSHVAHLQLPPRQVATYAFMRDPTSERANSLSVPEGVCEHVVAGASHAERGAFDEALEDFETALAETTDEAAMTPRVLAAWANHWAGDDERAVELVTAALEADANAWDALIVGIAADHTDPQKFRDGELSVRPYLRWIVEESDDSSITPSAGYPGDDGTIHWQRLTDGTADCTPIDRLEPEMRLRLEISGKISAFPSLHGYYLGIGVVEPDGPRARTIDRKLASGPVTVDSSETLAFSE